MPFTLVWSSADIGRALLGGALIGLSSSSLMLLAGRITGISGIVGSFLNGADGRLHEGRWRLAYLVGLSAGGLALGVLGSPAVFGTDATARSASPLALLLGGLLVGAGTRLGSGCTSGHGVCGLPRLSPRSLAAVGTFMAAGGATATLLGSVPALHGSLAALSSRLGLGAHVVGAVSAGLPPLVRAALPLAGLAAVGGLLTACKGRSAAASSDKLAYEAPHWRELAAAGCAAVFAVGLGLSGMTSPLKVRGFLDVSGPWHPDLMGVMGAAVGVNALAFALMARMPHPPVLCTADSLPLKNAFAYGPAHKANSLIDRKLLLGALLFGCGWGVTGICPGPGLVAAAGANGPMHEAALWYLVGMLGGMLGYELAPSGPVHVTVKAPAGGKGASSVPAPAAAVSTEDK